MPVARRDDGENEPTGGSGGGKKRKSKSHPTSKKRGRRQSVKERYAKAREDAQLAGIIPTTPEGAVRPEAVDPASQEDAPQPALVEQAIRRGWAVPEERKPALVDELVKIVDSPADGMEKVKVAAFRALCLADQQQYERDHPEEAKRLRGAGTGGVTAGGGIGTVIGAVNVVQSNEAAAAIVRGMIERGELGLLEELPAPDITGAPGSGGQQRPLEGGTAPPGDQ